MPQKTMREDLCLGRALAPWRDELAAELAEEKRTRTSPATMSPGPLQTPVYLCATHAVLVY